MNKLSTCLLLSFFVFQGLAQPVDMSIFHGMKPRNIGPAGMSGRVTAIDVELRDDDNILIGTAAGGVWRSENAGHTWKPIFESELAASIGDIAIHQANPNIIYVGTGEGNPRNSQNSGWGMFKSIDGGRTWEHLGLENTRQIHRVIVNRDNPDIVVIGASGASWGESEDRGVYKTVDGGKTWRKVLYINNRTGVSDLVVDPSNPNKMIVGMWEHRRWPWFFKSGGAGSGMYITYDGGETWEQVTDGLPEGELGRIGLSFAPSKPNVVYAYVESEKNAVFRSEDGGESWKQVSKAKDSNIGGRPFYYADIYVDVKNENRVYSIASEVTSTEDGGKTWQVFAPGNKIHTDHHAWWGHPDDPDFLMIGHDGGLNISHDRGKNWWFADNLPLAQFYHVRVDNEIPYNVYGGLQDNGSWRGPSQSWFKGGIRNLYWQRLSVGDGFDMIPDPLDNEYGYAMGQAGNLVRYHYPSGQLKRIKPVHPGGEYLRFNWNAGIAIDPHDQKTIYYGSQYVHKTSDNGASWEIISPDLTTDDPEKQDFLASGGLSYDVTGAEFHTTIISIAPSALQQGVIWVGTDDGKLHVTQDGGGSWSDLTSNVKGVPANTWIPHIIPSKHVAGEAFVVYEDHRRNNWEPYVYRTRNFGKSWERIVSSDDVRGYALSFEQDPVEPKLLFSGTEFGLYVSFDEGDSWNQWTSGYPTMPAQDMVIHPREHDLVIGTFGRSFWILDDIRPLREMASAGTQAVLDQAIAAFEAPQAYLSIIGESHGYRHGKVGDALYNGENRPYGALLSYYLKEVSDAESGNALEDSVKVEIASASGEVVRTLYKSPKAGVNRLNWDLTRDAVRMPGRKKPTKPTPSRSGMTVPAGTYQVTVSYGGAQSQTEVVVVADPRLEVTPQQMQDKDAMIRQHYQMTGAVTSAMDRLRAVEAGIKNLEELLKDRNDEEAQQALAAAAALHKELKGLNGQVLNPDKQGIYRDPGVLENQLQSVGYFLDNILVPVTPNQQLLFEQIRTKAEEFIAAWEKLDKERVEALRKQVEGLGISPF